MNAANYLRHLTYVWRGAGRTDRQACLPNRPRTHIFCLQAENKSKPTQKRTYRKIAAAIAATGHTFFCLFLINRTAPQSINDEI